MTVICLIFFYRTVAFIIYFRFLLIFLLLNVLIKTSRKTFNVI